MIRDGKINPEFYWFCKPEYSIENNSIIMKTSPDTDFWQKTHYGFVHDNGHCLLTKVKEDFSITVRTRYQALNGYDQCGLVVRLDAENWIKCSTEYETPLHSRLGSVVTNLGYSDWATIDLFRPVTEMFYRIQSKNNDFLIEYAIDGIDWKQMRICRLLKGTGSYEIGIYACSPMNGSFTAQFDQFLLEKSSWRS